MRALFLAWDMLVLWLTFSNGWLYIIVLKHWHYVNYGKIHHSRPTEFHNNIFLILWWISWFFNLNCQNLYRQIDRDLSKIYCTMKIDGPMVWRGENLLNGYGHLVCVTVQAYDSVSPGSSLAWHHRTKHRLHLLSFFVP